MMMIKEDYGRKIVCRHMFKADEIRPGQEWQSSTGHIVTVQAVEGGLVKYTWTDRNGNQEHEKDWFSFQCRYCLIVEDNDAESQNRRTGPANRRWPENADKRPPHNQERRTILFRRSSDMLVFRQRRTN